ncbi:MAG: alternative oxidase [Acidimicrobiales bacterium]
MSEGPPKLDADELLAQQRNTLTSPRRRYAIAARMLFVSMDLLYGRERSLAKFKVLEIVARVPYQAWEQVAYITLTHRYNRLHFARRVFERVNESRSQQDNEQWHLLIIQELLDETHEPDRLIRHRLVPQAIAFLYYQLSVLLFIVRPKWSYRLNADFEDHAEHEYARFVDENVWLSQRPYDGVFADDYGRFATLADLFRQIGHDERVHKLESLQRMDQPRFS